jgi:dihydrofolate synthase/folylpolyglutamate synthase
MAQTNQERLSKLFARRQSGVKLDLDGMQSLCSALGNPERNLKFIHIAGTNGKGSVAAMCSSILKEQGLRVGLYTSPHLIRYNERFRFNEKDISDDDLERWLSTIFDKAKDQTFFEVSTALALGWFLEKNAQIVVWETGLGGRLDATNVVMPEVCVITKIGMDHMQFLGSTLVQIAEEKAGILKPHIPAFTISQEPEVISVLETQAKKIEASLKILRDEDLTRFHPPLAGEHQRGNAALAIRACQVVSPNLDARTIEHGLAKTMWPGRCQLYQRGDSLPPMLLDGAHNPLGVKVLIEEIKRRWTEQKVTLIFGALGDKDISEMAKLLSEIVWEEVFVVPVQSERAANTEKICSLFPSARTASSLSTALALADQRKFPIVITGSLFLIGEALAILQGKEGVLDPSERMSRVI